MFSVGLKTMSRVLDRKGGFNELHQSEALSKSRLMMRVRAGLRWAARIAKPTLV